VRAYVYIDGYNLYYGALAGTPYRWLNLAAFSRLLLPREHDILSIKYFTAQVKPLPGDRDHAKPDRQQIYWQALRTLPHVEIIEGFFSITTKVRYAVTPLPDGSRRIKVYHPEEKGSDVNLATHLIHDAHMGAYDVALIITNDADLRYPIQVARQALGRYIAVTNPLSARAEDGAQIRRPREWGEELVPQS
jgi:uncharacterized LabA/DUF88 family protein